MQLTKTALYQRGNEVLWYFPQVFSSFSVDDFFDLPWQQNTIRVFGKMFLEPRLTCYFGPKYAYSTIEWPARDLPNELEMLRAEIQKITGFNSNAVLCNLYRGGLDSMGWHADNEKEIDQHAIASVSFGASRKMEFRHIATKERLSVELHHGDLLMMEDFQQNWQHAIFKKKMADPRINFTFRLINSI
jgi:alkylated DNA repair dioxygenase AlkB